MYSNFYQKPLKISMNYKKDFPLLVNHPEIIYLDSAATAQKPSYVIDGMKNFMENSYANIHRGMYELSETSEELYESSKKAFAQIIGAKASDIIYTYNATYAFNILVQALILSQKLKAWDKILLWIAEHHANIVPRQITSRAEWIEIEWINLDENYDLDLEDFKKKYTDNVKVVSLSAASNVTGKIYNLRKLALMLRDETILVVDWSQVLPHMNFQVKDDKYWCDVFIATGHKIMADTGIGMMYIDPRLRDELQPSIGWGGSIETVSTNWFALKKSVEKFEPGTPHIIGAVSLLKAIEYINSIGWYEAIQKHEHELVEYTLEKFNERADKITLIWPRSLDGRIWIFSFVVPSFENHTQLGELLAARWICIRSGGHCTHPFFEQIEKKGSCRMSLYLYNTKQDVDMFFDALDNILSR